MQVKRGEDISLCGTAEQTLCLPTFFVHWPLMFANTHIRQQRWAPLGFKAKQDIRRRCKGSPCSLCIAQTCCREIRSGAAVNGSCISARGAGDVPCLPPRPPLLPVPLAIPLPLPARNDARRVRDAFTCTIPQRRLQGHINHVHFGRQAICKQHALVRVAPGSSDMGGIQQ